MLYSPSPLSIVVLLRHLNRVPLKLLQSTNLKFMNMFGSQVLELSHGSKLVKENPAVQERMFLLLYVVEAVMWSLRSIENCRIIGGTHSSRWISIEQRST
ncbi:hypothetical protein L195_g029866 [Trifolium pratense]|uniref:Uncharacterized protein n=1 Tax=Trifolium pratense TaxID=57577 RepID=A0A2K3L5Z6_TRIPR|nr:hypothetical protein L195_g029866 [Trifolium pratense]